MVALTQVTLLLTQSATALGVVLLCRSLPGIALGPFVGPIVDRFSKRPILLSTDIVRAVCALGYSLAVSLHTSWPLYVGSLLLGGAGVFFDPARSAAIPRIVQLQELPEANALDSGMAGIVQILGAAGGGILAVAVNPIACFAINGVSYLWSALCIFRAHWNDARVPDGTESTYAFALVAGVREVSRNRVARAIIFIGISWGLAGGGYYILIPILGQQTFRLGSIGIGLLYTIDGLGVIVGSLLVRYAVAGRDRRASLWYGLAYLTQALFFALLARSGVFLVGALMLFLMRVSSGVIIPLDSYLLQANSHPGMRGRIFALHSSTYGGVMLMSYLLMGYAYAHFGIPNVGLFVGATSFLCGATWLLQFGGQRDEFEHS